VDNSIIFDHNGIKKALDTIRAVPEAPEEPEKPTSKPGYPMLCPAGCGKRITSDVGAILHFQSCPGPFRPAPTPAPADPQPYLDPSDG